MPPRRKPAGVKRPAKPSAKAIAAAKATEDAAQARRRQPRQSPNNTPYTPADSTHAEALGRRLWAPPAGRQLFSSPTANQGRASASEDRMPGGGGHQDSAGHQDLGGQQYIPEDEEPEDIEPRISASVALRVDKANRFNHQFGRCLLNEFDIQTLDTMVQYEAQSRGYLELGFEIEQIFVVFRAKAKRATWTNQSISEMQLMEWSNVLGLILNHAADHRGKRPSDPMPEVEVRFDVRAKLDPILVNQAKKAAIAAAKALEPLPATPSAGAGRVGIYRTAQLLQDAGDEELDNQAHGKENKRLVDRWQCNDEHCINSSPSRGYCWIDDRTGLHYSIEGAQMLKWAKSIQHGDHGVSIENPPKKILLWWVNQQGPVTNVSKHSGKAAAKAAEKSASEQMMEMLKMQTEVQNQKMLMKMQQQMVAANSGDDEELSRPKALQQQQPTIIFSPPQQQQQQATPWGHYPFPPPHQPQYPYGYGAPAPPAPRIAPALTPPSPPSPPSRIQAVAPARPRSSSPIQPANVAIDWALEFFQWKLDNSPIYEKEDIMAAYKIIKAKKFKVQHLKAMSSLTDPMFLRATSLGIPDGMALDFKADLKLFKAYWRINNDAENGAALLQEMAQGTGT